MKKLFAFSILILISLTGCTTVEGPELPKNSVQITDSKDIPSNSSLYNSSSKTLSGNENNNTVGTISSEKPLEVGNIKNLSFVEKLTYIGANGIRGSLSDNTTWETFTSHSGSSFIGTVADWNSALSVPFSGSGTAKISIYNQFVHIYDPIPVLTPDRYCFSGSDIENSVLIDDLFNLFENDSSQPMFSTGALNPLRIKSNIDTYPSNPITPLERLITSQIFIGTSVERYIAARPYGKNILVLYATSQEPGIPSYNVVRIYQNGDSLYAKNDNEIFNLQGLNAVYGPKFDDELLQVSYDVESKTEGLNGKISDEENYLLSGDWLKNPSIVNKKIEEKILKEFLEWK